MKKIDEKIKKVLLGMSALVIGACSGASSDQEVEVVHPTKFEVNFEYEEVEGEAQSFAKQSASVKLGARLNIKDINNKLDDIALQKVKALGVCNSSQKETEFQANEKPMLLDLLPGNIFLETGKRVVADCRLKLSFPQEKTSDFVWEKPIYIDFLSAITYDPAKKVETKTISVSFNGVYQILAEEAENISKAQMHRIQCERVSQDFKIHNVTSKSSIKEEILSWIDANREMMLNSKCRIIGLSRSGASVFMGPLFIVHSDIDLRVKLLGRATKIYYSMTSHPTLQVSNLSDFDVLVYLPPAPIKLTFISREPGQPDVVDYQHPRILGAEHLTKDQSGDWVLIIRAGEVFELDFEYDFEKIKKNLHAHVWHQKYDLINSLMVAVSDPRVEKRFRQVFHLKENELTRTFSIKFK